MVAYDPAAWSDLFVATAGASAALAGLLFVAVSINIERILAFPGLPERALETLLMLISVLLVSVVGLAPGQSHVALGLELLALSLTIGVVILRLSSVQASKDEPRDRRLARWVVRLAGTLPMPIGALSLLFESGGGLYWILAGLVLALAAAVANAWVLLVEILR